MKRRLNLAGLIVIVAFLLMGCAPQKHEGSYREYITESELYTTYFSLTLKKDAYSLSHVKVTNGVKSTDILSSGSYKISNDNVIIFTESNNETFSGTYAKGKIVLTYNYITYSLVKV